MPFKLIYFYPKDTFIVKVKVTESLTEIGTLENICQAIYLFRLLAFSFRNMLHSATIL